jgi:hypothetical protein
MDNTEPVSLDAVPTDERKPKSAYSYSRDTGEYVGEARADPDPLEFDNWLVPAQATLIQPPDPAANKTPVFDSDKWTLVDDFRGDWYSKADGSIVSFHELGPLPENLTDVACPGPHYKWGGDSWVLDTEEESDALAAQASVTRDGLLSIAAIRIAPLQDAVDLGKATPAKAALLKKWKEYRIDLDDVPGQAGYPQTISWPVVPS